MQLRISSTNHLNNAGFFYTSYNSLPDWRKNAIDRCRNEADKFRSLTAGELLMDAFLDSYPKLCREDMGPVATNEHGKPYLSNYPEWKYNISHSGKYAAIAYDDYPGRNEVFEIGVDIQSTRKISDGVARRTLTESELSLLPDKLDSTDCQTLLNALWSVKEAYIKFIGVGLSFDMRKVEIVNLRKVTDAISSDSKKDYAALKLSLKCLSNEYPDANCHYFALEEGYHLSVCSNSLSLPDMVTIVSA